MRKTQLKAVDSTGSFDPYVNPLINMEELVGGRLRELWRIAEKEKNSVTQEALSKILGVTPSAVSHLISGRSRFSLTTAYATAQLLGKDLRELMPDMDSEAKELVTAVRKSDGIQPALLKRIFKVIRKDWKDATNDWVIDMSVAVADAFWGCDIPTDDEILSEVKRLMLGFNVEEHSGEM